MASLIGANDTIWHDIESGPLACGLASCNSKPPPCPCSYFWETGTRNPTWISLRITAPSVTQATPINPAFLIDFVIHCPASAQEGYMVSPWMTFFSFSRSCIILATATATTLAFAFILFQPFRPFTHFAVRISTGKQQMASKIPKLFQPIRVGTANLQHRVVLAPMTRCRADAEYVHGPLAVEYYKQRTSVPGTLAITEATFIAAQAGGLKNVPGIWSDKQIAAWKTVTDAVHANTSSIFLQLWALGRAANPEILREDGGHPHVAPSAIPLKDGDTPRPLTVEEIKEYVQLFATAAENAVLKAGFDGVEIHAANGYLPDQFLQTNSNTRTDEYGGSVENRTRFVLEIADKAVEAVGANKVGIRLSPWSTFQGMRMPDPIPTFAQLVTRIRDNHPDFAYIHVLDPPAGDNSSGASNKVLRDIWGDRPYIANTDFQRDTAIETVEKEGGLVSFGRHFIANPDLPFRLKENIGLASPNRETFYSPGAEGYIDYPFAAEAEAGSLKSRY